jgi:hypothetical protein
MPDGWSRCYYLDHSKNLRRLISSERYPRILVDGLVQKPAAGDELPLPVENGTSPELLTTWVALFDDRAITPNPRVASSNGHMAPSRPARSR